MSQEQVETIRVCVEIISRVRRSMNSEPPSGYDHGWEDACKMIDREVRKLTGENA